MTITPPSFRLYTDTSKSNETFGKTQKEAISLMAAAAVARPNFLNPLIEAYIINIRNGGAGLYVKEPLEGRIQMAISLKTASGRHTVEKIHHSGS